MYMSYRFVCLGGNRITKYIKSMCIHTTTSEVISRKWPSDVPIDRTCLVCGVQHGVRRSCGKHLLGLKMHLFSLISESGSDAGSSTPPQPAASRGRGRPRKLRGSGRGRPRTQRNPDPNPRAPTRRGRRRLGLPVDQAAAALEERRRDIEVKET
jgi:hypothetical protein